MENEEIISAENQEQMPMSKKEMFLNRLKEKYPDMDEEQQYEALLNELDEHEKNKKALSEIDKKLNEHPRAAVFLASIMDGVHPLVASKRYFSEDEMAIEEGTPEYDELINAEKERIAEMEEKTAKQVEYEKNLSQSEADVEAFKVEKEMSDEDFNAFIAQVVELTGQLFEGKLTKDLLKIYHDGLRFENEISLAEERGRISARNEKIKTEKKMSMGDGLPSVKVSAPVKSEMTKRKLPIRKSAWDA